MIFPIDNWSYSAIMLFLRNGTAFKKKYILKIYDSIRSPAGVTGEISHKALAAYYDGLPPDACLRACMNDLEMISDAAIDFGKTGSREKIIQDVTRNFQGYIETVPMIDGKTLQAVRDGETMKFKIKGIEKKVTTFNRPDGTEMQIPIKSIIDLVVENPQGELESWDHKFVSAYTDSETEKPAFIIQAVCNYVTIAAEYGRPPKRMVFNEYKGSRNTNGDQQLQPYVIEFDQHPEYFAFFWRLLDDITGCVLNPEWKYLPNLDDMFDGEDAFNTYRQGLISIDAAVESQGPVAHKTKIKKFVEPTYVASQADTKENEFVVPEDKIRSKLGEFGLTCEMKETYMGSSIILYTLKPGRGTKMSRFEDHAKDIARVLKAKTIRVLAPIMGTDLVGIEVPNPERKVMPLEQWWPKLEEHRGDGKLIIPIGIDVYGGLVVKDLAEMPHLLVAGATGAGKSVMLNVAISSLTRQHGPDALQMILIDPKRVELSQFKALPHLMAPPIYEEAHARRCLNWLVEEMEVRYADLESAGKRNIGEYNAGGGMMKPIVVVIDEFADLILQSQDAAEMDRRRQAAAKLEARRSRKMPATKRGKARKALDAQSEAQDAAWGEEEGNDRIVMTAEQAIVRLGQKARAVGIHLILGTQRPSVDVVTGLIKANIPTRIAFMATSKVDSKIILDESGAEELVGKGDMLFLDPATKGLQRLQGLFA